jgi:four helix bundle protein
LEKTVDKQELKNRTMQFALRVLRLCSALPRTIEGRAVRGQLFRAGSSVASNYRAACKARSTAEFVAKIGTVEEESDESAFWMEFIMLAGMVKKQRVESLHEEAEELRAIMASSRKTASQRGRSERNRQSEIGNRK